MKILVCGGRDYSDYQTVKLYLDTYVHEDDCIIDGMAKGADSLAYQYAKEHGIASMRFEANWDFYNKAAGHIRNHWMLKFGQPDMVIAFPGGRGTQDMINKTQARDIALVIVK